MECGDNIIETTGDGSHTLYSHSTGDHFHSVHGAIAESKHVYINNGFKLLNKKSVRVLEAGFGTGLNAYLTLIEAGFRDIDVEYYSVEKFPIPAGVYRKLNYPDFLAGGDRTTFELLHTSPWDRLAEIKPGFRIKKIRKDISDPGLTEKFDIIYFDAFAPSFQPGLWSYDVISEYIDLLDAGGLFVTYSSKGELKRILKRCGCVVTNPPGPEGKREITKAEKG